jgi:hypothetical protein
MHFENFYADMGDCPPRKSIDRINNNGNYTCGKCDECLRRGEPANCRWATGTEQGSNTRRTVTIDWAGETHTLAEWSRILNIHASTIIRRHRRGDSLTIDARFRR